MTPLRLMERSRRNAIEHCKLLIKTWYIDSNELYDEDEDLLKALDEASNNGTIN